MHSGCKDTFFCSYRKQPPNFFMRVLIFAPVFAPGESCMSVSPILWRCVLICILYYVSAPYFRRWLFQHITINPRVCLCCNFGVQCLPRHICICNYFIVYFSGNLSSDFLVDRFCRFVEVRLLINVYPLRAQNLRSTFAKV